VISCSATLVLHDSTRGLNTGGAMKQLGAPLAGVNRIARWSELDWRRTLKRFSAGRPGMLDREDLIELRIAL